MKAIEISNNIYRIGLNLGKDILFEGIWPVPDGVSINAYAVKGDKIALIDSMEESGSLPAQYEKALEEIGIEPNKVSYLVVNHMEPDHSGWVRRYVAKNPKIEVVCSAKTVPLLKNFCGISENVKIVKTGDSIDLGQDKELVFYETPNVHWPETIMTFEKESGILFSCDGFGSYGAISEDEAFDDELNESRLAFFKNEALRYYANIVASFSNFVTKAIDLLRSAGLNIKIIAPSHGIIWRGNPAEVITLYEQYAEYAVSGGENAVCLIWSSMYGNTEKGVAAVREACHEAGIALYEHRTPNEADGFILADIWRSRKLVLAMPTYEYKMFPPMTHVLDLCQRKHMYYKDVFRFGSYGWVGGAEREFRPMAEALKWNVIDSVEWAGAPSKEDYAKIKAAVIELAAKAPV